MFSLTGKIALITGASGGIGGEIATTMSDMGAIVILNGRDAEKLSELHERMLTRKKEFAHNLYYSCNEIYTVPLNLMDIDATGKLIKTAIEKAGKNIDILVNAAGVHEMKSFSRITTEQLHNIMEMNFRIPFRLCQMVIKQMATNNFGRIINISSAAAHGAAGQAHYNSSKGALDSLTKSLASNPAFVQSGVTINGIAPGIIDTCITKNQRNYIKEKTLLQIPMGRFGTLDEVASVAAFLASNAASYINGQIISVDGGMVR